MITSREGGVELVFVDGEDEDVGNVLLKGESNERYVERIGGKSGICEIGIV